MIVYLMCTLNIGSSTSWQKVRGSFLPSALFAVLLNFPQEGSKYLRNPKQGGRKIHIFKIPNPNIPDMMLNITFILYICDRVLPQIINL